MEQGKTGDRIVVESERVGQPLREGQILEVLGTGETTHYLVRWEDGHTSTFYPSGGSANIIHSAKKSTARKTPAA